jgi:RHS repeat-associated protein
LGYYNQDYTAIGGSAAAAMVQAVYQHPSGADNTGRQLFNGNISHTEVALSKIDNGAAKGYSYGYDQLNRLLFMNQHTISGNTWSNSNIITAYAESIAYDANGNILQYQRKGANGTAGPLDMDSLNYKYNRDVNGNIVNNRLNHVRDQVGSSNYTVDIDNQNSNNYSYDKIGNLKTDAAETISNIDWTVYGKIRNIFKTDNTTISYTYDAGGNRTYKIVVPFSLDDIKMTWYIRDAQGNTLAVYSKTGDGDIKWDEQHLYGSSRLGMWNWDTIVPAAPPVVIGGTPLFDSLLCGSRTYELANHLGNVLSTISDKKIGHDNGASVVDYYLAEVLSQNDYYPGGMELPGRQYNAATGYRYGFNGKEKDTESPVQYDYGFRIYDPRLVRFKSVDPIAAKYPELTPYQFASNSPISGIDQDGLEYIHFTVILNKDGTVFKKLIAEDFRNRSEAEMNKMHNTTDFYKQYSAGFGPEGKGVKYTYFRINDERKLDFENSPKDWEVRQNDIGSEITRHGLYAGEGSITKKGPLFESEEGPGKGYYEDGYKPIDMGDALARVHDKEEDFVGFKGWQNPQNIFADIRLVKGLEKYLELAKDKNFIDPFTNRKPSEEGLGFAKNAVTLFKIEIGLKKLRIIGQAINKEISMELYRHIERVISHTEDKPVTLPEPNKTDK